MIPLVLGTRVITSVKAEGEFYCPACQLRQAYRLKQVRTFFHLYWLPLFPVSKPQTHVECRECLGRFGEEALSFDPAAERTESRRRFYDDVWRFLLSVAAADGDPVPAEVDYIRKHLQGFDDSAASLANFEAAIKARELPESLAVDEIAARFSTGLTSAGKEYAMIQGIQLAATDGTVNGQEWAYLISKAEDMGMTEAHFKGLLMLMTTTTETETEPEGPHLVQ